MNITHESHPDISRTKTRLRELYWWPRMDEQVEELVRTYVVCQSCDKSAHPIAAPLQPVAFPDKLWDKVAIDILGHLDQAPADCRFAITLMDYYSKRPEVVFTGIITTTSVQEFLLGLFAREGYPQEIVSDHGPQFSSAEMQSFLKEGRLRHCYSSVYHPQANGLVERLNSDFKAHIKLALLE